MENNKLLSLSIIIFALSIVFSSIWIGHSLENLWNAQIPKEKALLTQEESAQYLNISIEEFKNLLLTDKDIMDSYKKQGGFTHVPYKFIPYIEISKENKMFSKIELDKWIEYNVHY